jgi:2-dehydro-3-deoxyphosphooctonate aldolase (KDO 8-P synthase)
MRTMLVGDGKVTNQIKIGKNLPLVFIGGPCAIESRDHAMKMAEDMKKITDELNIPFIYKSCYDKDCRSSIGSFHGVGLDAGLKILNEIRHTFKLPVTCDFSDASWGSSTGEVIDLVQIPAYLCRQTSILVAAGKTGKPINIKKGQFMSPWNMRNSVKKIKDATGNEQVMLAERGTFLGYNMLVNDFKSLPTMQESGCPVCYDATHSIQLPTSMGSISGGQREFIPSLVRAAAASGIQSLFMEIHDDPDNALSDPATQLDIKYMKNILIQAKAIHEMRNEMILKLGEDNVK